jgi:hypothetical protein
MDPAWRCLSSRSIRRSRWLHSIIDPASLLPFVPDWRWLLYRDDSPCIFPPRSPNIVPRDPAIDAELVNFKNPDFEVSSCS